MILICNNETSKYNIPRTNIGSCIVRIEIPNNTFVNRNQNDTENASDDQDNKKNHISNARRKGDSDRLQAEGMYTYFSISICYHFILHCDFI